MQELSLTPSTIVLVILIAIGVFFAVRRLVSKGLCDCNDKCGDCEGCASKPKLFKKKTTCASCGAADQMVNNLNASLSDKK